MSRRFRALLPLALLIVWLAPAGRAAASPTQESWFMDDDELARGSDQEVEATMAILASLGVDRVRVSVFWNAVAPDPKSHARPAFGAGGEADPAGYPAGHWDRYDRVVLAAQRYGLALHFTFTGPPPLWASSNPDRNQPILEPSPTDFRDFVTAVGLRYSGTYSDEQPQPTPEPGGLPILPPPERPPPPAAALPRVSSWSTWNEPNQPGWLRPQWAAGRLPASPRLYRALQDAAYEGLARSGHGADTYLLGETAPRGGGRATPVTPMRPLIFIRDLYCVDRRLRPFRGRAAAARGCPTDHAGRTRFPSDHPGLFKATGFAHHPYALELPPQVRDRTRDQVTLATLDRLPRTLDGIFRRYGRRERLPIWLTEYGYQTNPPDNVIGVSWKRQADYLGRAENISLPQPASQVADPVPADRRRPQHLRAAVEQPLLGQHVPVGARHARGRAQGRLLLLPAQLRHHAPAYPPRGPAARVRPTPAGCEWVHRDRHRGVPPPRLARLQAGPNAHHAQPAQLPRGARARSRE